MSCAPTTTVATPTMAAAAVPSAACARHRFGIEHPRFHAASILAQKFICSFERIYALLTKIKFRYYVVSNNKSIGRRSRACVER